MKKKFDNVGVGKAEAAARSHDWSLEMCNFDSALSKLTEVTAKQAQAAADAAQQQASDISTDSQQAAHVLHQGADHADAAAASCKSAAAGESKKRQRQVQDRSTAAAAAASPEAPAVKAGVKRPKHTGRYSKREKGKLVQGYSAMDLAAILGKSSPGEHWHSPSCGTSHIVLHVRHFVIMLVRTSL